MTVNKLENTEIFAINESMGPSGSGIETAQLMRYKLLKRNGISSHIVYSRYTTDQYMHSKNAGVDYQDIFRIYDTFLGYEADNFKTKKLTTDNLKISLPKGSWTKKDNTEIYVADDSKTKLATAEFHPNGNIAILHKFDFSGKIVSNDFFDYRGYHSFKTYYDLDGFSSFREFYRPDGTVGIEQEFSKDTNPLISMKESVLNESAWKVINKNGTWQTFNNSFDFKVFLWSTIIEKYKNKKIIFIIDRAPDAQEVIPRLQEKYSNIRSVFMIHNNHGSGNDAESMKVLNDNYEYALNNVEKYNSFVVATSHQARDFKKAFPKANVYTIPVGVILNKKIQYKRLTEKQVGRVVAFVRLAVEKQLDQLASIVAVAHQSDPRIRLDIYGYANNDQNFKARTNFDNVVKKYNAQDYIKRHDYIADVKQKNEIEQNAEFYGITSFMEGFNIGLMEGLSNGLIGLSYDIHYGPDEMIKNGETGYLMKYEDKDAFVRHLLELTSNRELAEKIRKNAIDKSYEMFNSKKVCAQWVSMIEELTK